MATNVFIDFGGLFGIKGMHGTFTRGVTPSSFTLYCAPQTIPDGIYTLSFGQAGDGGMEFKGCAIAGAFIRNTVNRTPVMAVHVQDRRWKWKQSVVSGNFNARTAEGTVDPATKKEPSQLAAYILQALGETNFNTENMPTGMYPRADYVNKRADLALQELCDYVACEVVLNPVNDSIEIHPLGTGSTLSGNLGKIQHVPRTKIPAIIECRTGPVVWQTRLKLRAVSRNASAPQQKLLAEIEYKPQGGFETQSPFTFQSLTNTLQRAISFAAVWREYRVVGQGDGSLTPPFCNQPVSSVDQYILNDYLIESETDLSGYKRRMPYYVGGIYWPYTDLPENCSTEQYYNGDSTLYCDRRLVTFPVPLHGFNSTGQPVEPTLYLFTSYKVKNTAGELVYLFWSDTTGSQTGGKLILERPEVFAIFNNAAVPGSATDTSNEALQEASKYVAAFKRKYQDPYSGEVLFPGVVPGQLDGRLSSISWTIMPGGATFTKATENFEGDSFAISKKERTFAENLASLLEPK